MKKDWKGRFERLVAELRGNPKIKVVEARINPPATKGDLAAANAAFRLTGPMTEFYRSMDGAVIRWELGEGGPDAGGRPVCGAINLIRAREVFGEWGGVLYFEPGSEYADLHPIDLFVPEACAALKLDGSADPRVVYHYLGEEESPLGVDFPGYLELLLEAKGFWYWPKTLIAEEGAPSFEAANFREFMPQLFPDFSPGHFAGPPKRARSGQ